MRILSAFYLLVLATCALSETCPPDEDFSPCRCTNSAIFGAIVIRCEDNTISLKDLSWVLNRLKGLKNIALILTGLNLVELPSNFFIGTDITFIFITKCKLPRLEDGVPVFLGLEDSLKVITIDSSLTDEESPIRLNIGHLRRLISLSLEFNIINELSNDWLDAAPPSLLTVIINGNGIKIIGDRVFANLVYLETLHIEGNHLESIQRSMLPYSAQKLTTLIIQNNSLPLDLPEDIFSNMPVLENLYLQNIGISRLEQKTFENVWESLNNIEVSENPLVCDYRMYWMFPSRHKNHGYYLPTYLNGDCKYPEDQEGVTLNMFIRRKGKGKKRGMPLYSA